MTSQPRQGSVGEDALDRLRERIRTTRQAALDALEDVRWKCSDGHFHPRPEGFTANRLAVEINRRNPHNDWTSSEIKLGIVALRDEGKLRQSKDWTLSIVPAEETPTEAICECDAGLRTPLNCWSCSAR